MADRRQGTGELEARIAHLEAQLAGQAAQQRRRWRARLAVGAGLVGAMTVSSLAVGGVGDVLRQEVRNGTTGSETEIIGKFNATGGAKGGYVTRQSNTQTGPKAGGGAIYGCRGAAGGTAAGSAPCLRASNLANGFAFEFASNSGPAGLFDVAAPTDAPFTTDGGGLVTNLNADKVDGLDATQLKGQQGPKGDTGERGPSNAVEKFDDDMVLNIAATSSIKTIDLPAGSWVVNAAVTGDSDAAGVVFVECEVMLGGTKIAENQALLGAISDPGERQTVALTGGGTLASAGTAVLQCQSSDATTDFADGSLTAIQVATLDSQ